MHYVVAKDFKTANRRFSVGMPVTPEEIEGKTSFDMWKKGGFIVEGSPALAHVGDVAAEPISVSAKKAPPAT